MAASNGRPALKAGGELTPPTLSPKDEENLGRLEGKLQLVRDRTRAVGLNYSTGLYLYGCGGIGKSYTVLDELRRLQANYKLFNSRMTGKGLFNALEKFPDAVHVLEDMEQIMRDRGAQGVLRSALWGQRKETDRGPMERYVSWSTYRKEHSFVFTGGVIMLANIPLHDMPQLEAVKTRIACMHLHVSDGEMRALMRKVSLQGWESEGRRLDPAVCQEICEYMIGQALDMHRVLDMRLLVNSFQDRLQWEENDAGCHWTDLIDSRVRERATGFRGPVCLEGRAARKRRELEIAKEVVAGAEGRRDRFDLWQARTGKSEQTLYRRIAELEAEGDLAT